MALLRTRSGLMKAESERVASELKYEQEKAQLKAQKKQLFALRHPTLAKAPSKVASGLGRGLSWGASAVAKEMYKPKRHIHGKRIKRKRTVWF
jgi:hypothetical protein